MSAGPGLGHAFTEESEWSHLMTTLRDSIFSVFATATKVLPDSSESQKEDQQRAALLSELGQKLETFETICDEIHSLLDYNKNFIKIKTSVHVGESSPDNMQQLNAQVEQSRILVNQFKRELAMLNQNQ